MQLTYSTGEFNFLSYLLQLFPRANVQAIDYPRVLCIKPIPNIADNIATMTEKHITETIDIENVEFKKIDLELDSLFLL